MVANHFRWDFYGLSTDTKPDATNPRVADGSTYYEANTSKLYVWYKDQWYEKASTGGGGGGSDNVKVLTSEDYNYPESNPNSVGLWLLPPGVYFVDNSDSLSTAVKVHKDDTGLYYTCSFFEVTTLPQTSAILINVYGNFTSADGEGFYGFRQYKVGATGSEQDHVIYVNNTELAEVKPNSINPSYYDYPNNNPDGVAVWNLNDGNYKIEATEDYPIKLYFETSTTMDVCWGELYVKTLIDGNKFVNFEYLTYQQNNYSSEKGWCRVDTSTGTLIEMKMYTEESV